MRERERERASEREREREIVCEFVELVQVQTVIKLT